jgi:hypothetical protein
MGHWEFDGNQPAAVEDHEQGDFELTEQELQDMLQQAVETTATPSTTPSIATPSA